MSAESFTYKGEKSADGSPNGLGTEYHNGKIIFQGEFRNGKVDNIGINYLQNNIYKLKYNNGKPTGIGTIIYQNGNIYSGEINKDLQPDGYGVFEDKKEKYVCKGFFEKNGEKGLGKIFTKQNDVYYLGELKNFKPTGLGVKSTGRKHLHKGFFTNDGLSLLGKYELANSEYFVGTFTANSLFQNMNLNGIGFHFVDGYLSDSSKKGIFENNKLKTVDENANVSDAESKITIAETKAKDAESKIATAETKAKDANEIAKTADKQIGTIAQILKDENTTAEQKLQAQQMYKDAIDKYTPSGDLGEIQSSGRFGGVTYLGTLKNNRWYGYGKVVYPNYSTYSGSIINSEPEGLGKLTFHENSGSNLKEYYGFIKNYKPHGMGLGISIDGTEEVHVNWNNKAEDKSKPHLLEIIKNKIKKDANDFANRFENLDFSIAETIFKTAVDHAHIYESLSNVGELTPSLRGSVQYKGNLSDDNRIHGYGEAIMKDCCTYIGSFNNGQGLGKIIFDDSNNKSKLKEYYGFVKDYKPHGMGCGIFKDNITTKVFHVKWDGNSFVEKDDKNTTLLRIIQERIEEEVGFAVNKANQAIAKIGNTGWGIAEYGLASAAVALTATGIYYAYNKFKKPAQKSKSKSKSRSRSRSKSKSKSHRSMKKRRSHSYKRSSYSSSESSFSK